MLHHVLLPGESRAAKVLSLNRNEYLRQAQVRVANHWRLLTSRGKMQLETMYRLTQNPSCNGSVVRGALLRPVRAQRSAHPSVTYLGHLTTLFAGCLRRSHRTSLVVRAGTNGSAPPPWSAPDARLVLEDGSVWHGTSFGTKGTQLAEVVFNTSMTGYQEILTDPSYKGQFVVFTHPHIGNVGINPGQPSLLLLKSCMISLLRFFLYYVLKFACSAEHTSSCAYP